MSEGSFWPKTWADAVPLIVWGVLIFAAGFETIASLVHADWVPALASFVLLVGLTAVLLHWRTWLTRIDPNWIVAASLIVLLAIIASPFIQQRQLPKLSWENIGLGSVFTLIVVAAILMAVSSFVGRGQPATTPDDSNRTPARASAWDTPIDKIARNRLNDKVRTTGRATHVILTVEVGRIERALFNHLIAERPVQSDGDITLNESALQQSIQDNEAYIRGIGAHLSKGAWGNDFEYQMAAAEAEMKQNLKANPRGHNLAPEVNVFLYQDWAIAHHKVTCAVRFLGQVQRKLLEQERENLHRLREEMKHLDPRIFNQE